MRSAALIDSGEDTTPLHHTLSKDWQKHVYDLSSRKNAG